MPSIYNFNEVEMLAFVLVLLRMASFLASWPILGSTQVPSSVKVLFALVITLALFPVVAWKQVQVDISSSQIVWLAIREVFIGLSLGFLSRFFFFTISMAGEIISLSMGLSSSQLFNPTLGASGSTVEQFHIALATLFFLALNGHHFLFEGIVQSYNLVPLSVDLVKLEIFSNMGGLLQLVTEICIKMSAPVLVAILFMNLSMAVIGRAVPQINVLVTSLPVNILVGFLVVLVAMPMVFLEMKEVINITTDKLFQFMKAY